METLIHEPFIIPEWVGEIKNMEFPLTVTDIKNGWGVLMPYFKRRYTDSCKFEVADVPTAYCGFNKE